MAQSNDEELFRRSCAQRDLLTPLKSKSVCDAHGQIQTAKTRDGYGMERLLKDIENEYKILIQDAGINMVVPMKRGAEIENYPYFFYVDNIKETLSDSSESLHFHLCAFIEGGWTVLRETKFDVSPLALLPYQYEYSSENQPLTKYHIGLKLIIPEINPTAYASKEVVIDYLTRKDNLKLKCTFTNIPYDSKWADGQYRQEFACLAEFEEIDVDIKDDFGQLFRSFNDTAHLGCDKLPDDICGMTLKMQDRDQYAPLTTEKDIYCLLYAEKKNLVRVLRWLPTKADDMKDKPILPLHELGVIDCTENESFASFMTSTQNTLLFGKVSGNDITVICNMDGYYNSELSQFILPIDLFNLAK